jgi:hypothetical protein
MNDDERERGQILAELQLALKFANQALDNWTRVSPAKQLRCLVPRLKILGWSIESHQRFPTPGTGDEWRETHQRFEIILGCIEAGMGNGDDFGLKLRSANKQVSELLLDIISDAEGLIKGSARRPTSSFIRACRRA